MKRVGYRVSRETARSVRLTITAPTQHDITICVHDSIKLRTLMAILENVAFHLRLAPKQLQRLLFG